MEINLEKASIESLQSYSGMVEKIDVLRIDRIHPVISGNKWYKLRFYLKEAMDLGFSEIASFGGAYSNHLVAMACACKELGLKSIGFIRGEEPANPSETLLAAKSYGMQLVYMSRAAYKNKKEIIQNNQEANRYWIAEGGYGILGAKGAETILDNITIQQYTHLICAVGSGTMAAGLLNRSDDNIKVIGISSQKNNEQLEDEVKLLVATEHHHRFLLLHEYHFGGFAKHPQELIEFMKKFWEREAIPTDIVYTGKLFYAIDNLIQNGFFKKEDRLLVIHSGGLQGNLSLAKNCLPY
ncbi:MAG: pyridoxal-phosphate dependent enzyme [Chitinophagaceae bacterium]|nr:pyridoxal-phosphate dependent enzyme [Chitinophagaceae bacterium]